MRTKSALAAVATGAFLSLQVCSCHVEHVSADSPAAEKSREKTFIYIVYGSIRDKYSDEDLIAEGKKACEAFHQGQSKDQVQQMVASDMDFDSAELDQFMGAVYGGLECSPK